MKATVFVPCPNCKHVAPRCVEISMVVMPAAIWCCEPEDGGCGKSFVVRLMAQPQARTQIISDEEISNCNVGIPPKS